MERAGKRWAIGLTATFWVGAATVIFTEAARNLVALLLFLCGAAVLLVGWWPEIRSRFVSQTRNADSGAARVAADLRSYIEELNDRYEQSKGSPSEDLWSKAHRVHERAKENLVPWKRRVLEYLDSTIGHRAARDFWCLGDTRGDGNAVEHFQDSYERHREHLERIAAEVELGEIQVKWPPQRSGEAPLPVEDFVVKPPPCR